MKYLLDPNARTMTRAQWAAQWRAARMRDPAAHPAAAWCLHILRARPLARPSFWWRSRDYRWSDLRIVRDWTVAFWLQASGWRLRRMVS